MRVCAALLISISFYAASGKAQDILQDTQAALKQEWISATKSCLTSLRLYTTGKLTDDGSHLSPQDAESQARDQLIMGAPANEDLYKAAMTRSDFLEILATATTKDTSAAGQAKLFADDGVPKLINDIYKASGGKQRLIGVQSAAVSNKYLALFLLLNAYPLKGANPDSDALDSFRGAFKANSTELFNLVGKKNPAPAK